jgi:iron complex transport system substrate-binding protein
MRTLKFLFTQNILLHPISLAVYTLAVTSCSPPSKENLKTDSASFQIEETVFPLEVEYAKGFEIEYYKGYKVVHITFPGQSKEKISYVLVPHGNTIPDVPYTLVRTPIQTIICTATSHIPLLEALGVEDALIGFPNTKLISSALTRKKIDAGQVKDLGPDTSDNIETIIYSNPELVMAYFTSASSIRKDLLEKAGIPLVYNQDFMEENPLGKAEWIKFMSAFFNKEQQADSVFNQIKTRYHSLQQTASSVKNKPTVFNGNLYGDIWFMPGGKSWGAQFIKDAGAEYLWADNQISGSLQLSIEAVLNKASQADYWLNMGSYSSLKEILSADARYGSFQAFKNKKAYNFNGNTGPNGGIMYLELGYLRPDLVLSDLIKIFHPALLPDHELYFYHQLQ